MWSLSFYFYAFLLYYKEKRKLLLLSFCIIALSISSNYFFTKNYGVQGTATGVLVGYTGTFILTVFFVRKYVYSIFFVNHKSPKA